MHSSARETFVILPAAGSGQRMGGPQPKQYLHVGGEPILVWTVHAFANHPQISGVVIAVPAGDEERVRELVSRHSLADKVQVVVGGADRQASVASALYSLPSSCETVLVHDAVRPLVSSAVIDRVLAACTSGAVTAALPIHETIKVVEDGVVLETCDRNRLWAVQTPQGFPKDLLLQAHAAADDERATDDCALVERLGKTVTVVLGAPENIKITTPEDLPLVEMWLGRHVAPTHKRSFPGVGLGYDIHRLVEGRPLLLGGVEIPWERGLLGHSDADVLVHACMDALLGAAGLGDIGRHFPDSDPAFAGASSLALLGEVQRMLAVLGLRVRGLDAVIVAERPKLAAYLPTMQLNIATTLGIAVSCINVKASTNERLGALGHEEGIAAQAVAWLTSEA